MRTERGVVTESKLFERGPIEARCHVTPRNIQINDFGEWTNLGKPHVHHM